MLLIKKHIEKDQSGYVTLKAEEDEDMWHAYNLIQEVCADSFSLPSGLARGFQNSMEG